MTLFGLFSNTIADVGGIVDMYNQVDSLYVINVCMHMS